MSLKTATGLTAAFVALFVFAQPLPANAFKGGGKGGMMGQMGGQKGGMKGKGGGGEAPPAPTGEGGEAPNPEVLGAFMPTMAKSEFMAIRGFLETGLTPVYPEGFTCPPVTSPFATRYRTDGSTRSARFFQGRHGGMDIAQPEGTPLLAVADGEVIIKHEGEDGGIGGLGLWLRLAPEDTGTGKYVFIEYKHIVKLPDDLQVGDRVKKGQKIAETGNTGTTGGHYGDEGFFHLHMTAYWGDSSDFKFKRVMVPIGGQWLDPIALMRGGPLDSHVARDLPDAEKEVKIPFKSTDGRFFPADTKVVWPYACSPK